MLKIFFLKNNKFSSCNEFSVTKAQALQLELALNKSDKGDVWRSLGDKLYNYFISTLEDDLLLVDEEQFNYLKQSFINLK